MEILLEFLETSSPMYGKGGDLALLESWGLVILAEMPVPELWEGTSDAAAEGFW